MMSKLLNISMLMDIMVLIVCGSQFLHGDQASWYMIFGLVFYSIGQTAIAWCWRDDYITLKQKMHY